MSPLSEDFKNYLQNQSASIATVKNYVADVNHFLNWLSQEVNQNVDYQNLEQLFTSKNLENYKITLINNNVPSSTINRRLSALRKFGQCGLEKKWLTENPGLTTSNFNNRQSTTKTTNPEILIRFKKYLEKEMVSPITIKNYLSDLRHFLSWLETS